MNLFLPVKVISQEFYGLEVSREVELCLPKIMKNL